ncbi:MAG: S8 family serine peptidase [Shewanella sp.]|nr:S8 family serine peptidase [Shewanella sp.]
MPKIMINGYSFDPVDERPAMAAYGLDTPDTSATNYVLVQIERPLDKDDRAQLAEMGLEILAYEPEESYVAFFTGDDLSDIRTLSFVRAAIPYPAFVKVAKDLLDLEDDLDNVLVFSGAVSDVSDSNITREVDIVLQPGVDAESVKNLVADVVGLKPSEVEVSRDKFRATVNTERLHDLSLLDEVRLIESVVKPMLFNDVAIGILGADQLQVDGVFLRGSGQVVAVCDTGFDKGSSIDVHPAFTGRVLKVRALGGVNPQDRNGHGTHVAGSVLGDGVANGYGPVIGTAPGAKLVVQAAGSVPGNELAGLPINLYTLFATTYDEDSARVHNNSWGVPSFSKRAMYTRYAAEIDEFVRDNRDMVICFAAGNEGRDANKNGVIDNGSVSPPSTAKNCITVGASENFRPMQSRLWATGSWEKNYPSEPIKSDLWADDPMGMAAFSGRGPTQDGRTKPDLVAPGTSILSAHSRDARSRTFASLAANLTFWGTSPDPHYRYMGGTSMACPLVAGGAAVVREYLIGKNGIPLPSAALVKASLINSCIELSGQYVPSEAGRSPNHSSGFGRMDLRRAISVVSNGNLVFRDEKEALATGDEVVLDIEVSSENMELKATLVWTDEPGSALVNDLDLIVVAPDGTERHGNMPSGSRNYDRTNNVEQVKWENAPNGIYQVVVRAANVRIGTQSFALVLRVDSPA